MGCGEVGRPLSQWRGRLEQLRWPASRSPQPRLECLDRLVRTLERVDAKGIADRALR